jgi:hypothetical protein
MTLKKTKNEKSKTREVKVNDLQPEKNPTGGKGLTDIVIVKETDKPSTKLYQ